MTACVTCLDQVSWFFFLLGSQKSNLPIWEWQMLLLRCVWLEEYWFILHCELLKLFPPSGPAKFYDRWPQVLDVEDLEFYFATCVLYGPVESLFCQQTFIKSLLWTRHCAHVPVHCRGCSQTGLWWRCLSSKLRFGGHPPKATQQTELGCGLRVFDSTCNLFFP